MGTFSSLLAAVLAVVSTMAGRAAESGTWQAGAGYRFMRVNPQMPGKVGFTQVPGEQSGIRFTNRLTIETGARNQNLLSGAGVAAGDFDNDGLCDLYFCSLEGRNTLYRSLGNLRFEDVTDKAGVACPGMLSTGAIFADLNGDGFLDLVVTGNNGPNALFLNLGNGTFSNVTAAAGFTSRPLGSTSVAAADLDGNGTLDLFVANYGENTVLRSGGELGIRMLNGRPVVSGRAGRRLKIVNGKLIEFGEPSVVLLNDGALHFKPLSWLDGTFRDEEGQPLKEAPNDLSLSVMMRDINGDGIPDIYVCNDFQTPDRIWINDGHAHFRALPRLAMRSTSSFSMGVDFADIDRDGHDDFVVVDMLSRLHTLRMTQMSDTNMSESGPGEISNRPQIHRNTLLHNRGDGTYAEIGNIAGVAASDWTWTPVFLDVDLDGYEDLLVSNGHAWDTQDLDVTSTQRRGGGSGDAIARLRAYPRLDTAKYAFRNRGDLTFEEIGEKWGYNSHQVCHGIACADLDNDGDIDIVLSSLNAPPVLYRNDTAAPRVSVRLKGNAPNTRGLNARITVRGGPVPVQSQEVICGGRYLSGDAPVRTFAAGSLTNELTIEVTWRNGTSSVVRGALANTIVEIDEAGARPARKAPATSPEPLFKDVSALLRHQHHETAFDDFARQPLMSWKLSQLGPGVAWFDADGDGREELFIGAGAGGSLSMFRVGANGAFTRSEAGSPSGDDLLGLAGWVSQPGRRVLLAAKASYESAAPLVQAVTVSGAGAAASNLLENLPASPGAIAVGDYDGDGALDVFVAGRVNPGRYPEPVASRLYHNEGGKLVPAKAAQPLLDKLGLATAATWTDLDGDGLPELVVAVEWGPVRVFRYSAAGWRELTADLGLARWPGWWTSITAGDFDGDGRMDLVAGNWGLNTSFQNGPVRAFYGDFNGDGSVQQIDADPDPALNKAMPRENLSVLGPVMPFLRGQYPTYASLRTASIQEMLGDRFRAATELRADSLASMIFLNRSDHFEPVRLPAEAQWAPAFGLCVADADGDGREDLFVAQNFFATRKDVPRLDAGRGLWLRGDGTGRLVPMTAAESGVVVWGEQRGAAVADYDGDGRVDLVVTQNGAETKLFHNERARPGWRVHLKGPPGNPVGFGAVVWLKNAAGHGPAREIHSGAGYLSQDSAVPVLGFAGTPTHLVVRWPGGKVSETALGEGRDITVASP